MAPQVPDILEREELMAQQPTKTDSTTSPEILAILNQLVTMNTGAQAANPVLEAILARLDKRTKKEEDAEAAQAEMQRRAREANIRDVKDRRAREQAERAACNHRDEYNKTNIRGQRDHDQNVIYICQKCQDVWKNFARSADRSLPGNENYKPLPPDLLIDARVIGGPTQ